MARIIVDIDDETANYLRRQACAHLILDEESTKHDIAKYMVEAIIREKVAEQLGDGPLYELWQYFMLALILPSMALLVMLTESDISWTEWLWWLAGAPVAAFVMALVVFVEQRQIKFKRLKRQMEKTACVTARLDD